MRDRTFLVGRFLPAYGRAFGRLPHGAPEPGAFSPELLEKRFDERSELYRRRNREHKSGLQVGVIVAITLTIGAFRVDFSVDPPDEFVETEQEIVRMEEIQQTAQIEKPPPPPRPPVPVAVPDELVLDDSALDLDAFLDMDVAVDLPPPPPVPAAEEEDPGDEIFVVVEKQPTIIGGVQQIYEVTPYPEIARRSELEGTVIVKIVVNEDGTPSNPVVVRGVHEVLDNAAVKGVMSLRFEPGMQRNRPVKTYFAIPVRFQLN